MGSKPQPLLVHAAAALVSVLAVRLFAGPELSLAQVALPHVPAVAASEIPAQLCRQSRRGNYCLQQSRQSQPHSEEEQSQPQLPGYPNVLA